MEKNTYFLILEYLGGSLIIVDNNIKSIDGFNSLQTINGGDHEEVFTAHLEGNFDYIQFNRLKLIKGSTYLYLVFTSITFDWSTCFLNIIKYISRRND